MVDEEGGEVACNDDMGFAGSCYRHQFSLEIFVFDGNGFGCSISHMA
jgi:hypothetical protein